MYLVVFQAINLRGFNFVGFVCRLLFLFDNAQAFALIILQNILLHVY